MPSSDVRRGGSSVIGGATASSFARAAARKGMASRAHHPRQVAGSEMRPAGIRMWSAT